MQMMGELNELIDCCMDMKQFITENNTKVDASSTSYQSFLSKVNIFLKKNELDNTKYDALMEPYDYPKPVSLNRVKVGVQNGSFCYEEIEMLIAVLLKIKQDFCYEYSEKIFISHREKDKQYADLLIGLLHNMGIPIPSDGADDQIIFCSSHPAYDIKP